MQEQCPKAGTSKGLSGSKEASCKAIMEHCQCYQTSTAPRRRLGTCTNQCESEARAFKTWMRGGARTPPAHRWEPQDPAAAQTHQWEQLPWGVVPHLQPTKAASWQAPELQRLSSWVLWRNAA